VLIDIIDFRMLRKKARAPSLLRSGRAIVVAASVLALCDCGGNNGSTLATSGELPAVKAPKAGVHTRIAPAQGDSKIQHVVIIIQENRSFDNLFQGFPGADTKPYGYDTKGRKILLQPVSLEAAWDLDHSSWGFFQDCNGQGSIPGTDCKMNGFNQESVQCGKSGFPPCPYKHPQYAYVPHSETAPYFDMGKQYVLADKMFASNFDASSFISHQYIIAAQANSAVNYPYSLWGCDGGPSDTIPTVSQQRQIPSGYISACFNSTTLGDEFDDAGLSWRYYTGAYDSGVKGGGAWSAYLAIRHIYEGPDWSKDVINPQTKFFGDIANGDLATLTWITPNCANSDHAGCGSNTGPSWVASLVNAIGESKFWDSTAIFIFWDDYGGWYDHVPPQYVDYDGLGMRIPMLVVSAYAKKGYVSHVSYEHGSILKFIEQRFGLAPLSASDKRANSPEQDCFDFTQPPRRFGAIPSRYDKNYFLRQPLDKRPPDTE
jgi:phospholipase C